MPTQLADLTARLISFSKDRDWEKFQEPRHLIAALGVEAGELLETTLWLSDAEYEIRLSDPVANSLVRKELADVLIYALLLAARLGLDPVAIIEEKLIANAKKYPISTSRGLRTNRTAVD